MTRYRLVEHAPGAPGLRWLGLGTDLRPTRGLLKLQRLFRKHAFWAQNRNLRQLKRMLTGSTVVVSLWRGKRLVGFGRATSDGVYRAVLWDVVVASDLQGRDQSRRLVEQLLIAKSDPRGRADLPDDHQERRCLPALEFVKSNPHQQFVQRQ